jgi:hypothetical protein
MTATEVFLPQLRDGGGDLINISSSSAGQVSWVRCQPWTPTPLFLSWRSPPTPTTLASTSTTWRTITRRSPAHVAVGQN